MIGLARPLFRQPSARRSSDDYERLLTSRQNPVTTRCYQLCRAIHQHSKTAARQPCAAPSSENHNTSETAGAPHLWIAGSGVQESGPISLLGPKGRYSVATSVRA